MSKLGKYELLEKLGEGRFGEVYKARDNLGRTLALKQLKAAWASDPDTLARFQREAQAAGNSGGQISKSPAPSGRFPKVGAGQFAFCAIPLPGAMGGRYLCVVFRLECPSSAAALSRRALSLIQFLVYVIADCNCAVFMPWPAALVDCGSRPTYEIRMCYLKFCG